MQTLIIVQMMLACCCTHVLFCVARLLYGMHDVLMAMVLQTDAGPSKLNDGVGKYELVGIVSHMGRNTACGHYVCHLKKKGKWVIYNDEKVAISENPPRDLAYMYLCRRKDVSEE